MAERKLTLAEEREIIDRGKLVTGASVEADYHKAEETIQQLQALLYTNKVGLGMENGKLFLCIPESSQPGVAPQRLEWVTRWRPIAEINRLNCYIQEWKPTREPDARIWRELTK